MRNPLRIGLIVGHFNPPHLGHLYLGKRTLEKRIIDTVWIMPIKINEEFYMHQKCMINILTRDVPYHYFCEKEELEEYVEKQDLEISLLSGTDNYWNPPDYFLELKEKFPVIWMERPKNSRIPVHSIYGSSECNSTQIRKNIHKYKDWMPKEVYDYIIEEKLYL